MTASNAHHTGRQGTEKPQVTLRTAFGSPFARSKNGEFLLIKYTFSHMEDTSP
jgi:hypothetical protein